MPIFRYSTSARWWKGNTHIHSTISDGGKNFQELAELYHGAGYDFLFRTDHWAVSNSCSDPQVYPLLWLDGIELDGYDAHGANYHVVALGSFQDIQRSLGLEAAMEAAHAQGGMLILAHPHWTGNSFEEALRYPFEGVEIYNHVCHWLTGKSNAGPYWSAMLTHRPNTLAFCVDDAHIAEDALGWNGGWVTVNAEACTPVAILSALKAGNFYSSCGPSFESIEWDGNQVAIRCSPVQAARLVGPRWHAQPTGFFDGRLLTQAAFEIPDSWPYAYLEIEDSQGRRAWTNPLFILE
jgi:hypothetical protein